jgi:Bacterial alpha-L-rhamnosidase C-terminal domain
VLGVQTSPGFATFTVTPHPGGLGFARCTVPTPHGPIRVSWSNGGAKLSLQVIAPSGTVWENAHARQAAPTPTTGVVPTEELTKSPGTTAAASSSTAATRTAGTLAKELSRAWRAASGW